MPDDVDRLLREAGQARREGRLVDARRDLVEAVRLCRQAGAGTDLARALSGLGRVERDLGRRDAAQQHYGEACAIYRSVDDALSLAHAVRHVADIHRERGQPEQAEPCYQEALAIYRGHEGTPPLDLANAIRGLAVLKKHDAGLWKEARDLYAAAGVEAGVAECSQRLRDCP